MTRPINTRALAAYLRVGLFVAALLIGAIALLARNSDLSSTPFDNVNAPAVTHAVTQSTTYGCVMPQPKRARVDCTRPHAGVITAQVTAAELCPAGSDYYRQVTTHYRQISRTKQVFCIDAS